MNQNVRTSDDVDFGNIGPNTDYGASSTITGWDAGYDSFIHVKKVGKLVYVSFQITGTSNGTSCSFTVPYFGIDYNIGVAEGQNNGSYLTSPCKAVIQSSSTINIFSDFGTGGWASSGGKSVSGSITYVTN
jgi:hypothetical protein